MKYDFTSILDRRGKDAVAVDAVGAPGSSYPAPREGFDVIPMWVADMNFPVVPTVQQAMIARAEHPAFGYFDPPAEYYDSIIRWQEGHNGVTGLKPEHIGYENGVLGGVISAVNVLCSKGDNVLLHSPTYIGFSHCLTDNGYHIVHSPLTKDEQGVWRMDFADMEKKIVENHIHAAIFCSPHNPCGRVWERREVEQAMALYKKYDVMVVSDEIWSDILLTGYRHTPTQSVSEDAKMRTVALYAPSKTFNLAGLVGSYHIIYNSWLRDRCSKEAHQFAKGNDSLRHKLQVSRYDQVIPGSQCHAADVGIIGDDRSHSGPVRAHRSNAAYQASPRYNIHIVSQSVIGSLINNKGRIPVAGISADDPGSDLIIISVFLIQLQ